LQQNLRENVESKNLLMEEIKKLQQSTLVSDDAILVDAQHSNGMCSLFVGFCS